MHFPTKTLFAWCWLTTLILGGPVSKLSNFKSGRELSITTGAKTNAGVQDRDFIFNPKEEGAKINKRSNSMTATINSPSHLRPLEGRLIDNFKPGHPSSDSTRAAAYYTETEANALKLRGSSNEICVVGSKSCHEVACKDKSRVTICNEQEDDIRPECKDIAGHVDWLLQHFDKPGYGYEDRPVWGTVHDDIGFSVIVDWEDKECGVILPLNAR